MRLQCRSVPGGVPERPKGAVCKTVGSAYGGSNPPAPIASLFKPKPEWLSASPNPGLISVGERSRWPQRISSTGATPVCVRVSAQVTELSTLAAATARSDR